MGKTRVGLALLLTTACTPALDTRPEPEPRSVRRAPARCGDAVGALSEAGDLPGAISHAWTVCSPSKAPPPSFGGLANGLRRAFSDLAEVVDDAPETILRAAKGRPAPSSAPAPAPAPVSGGDSSA